jgi:SsrA-binding protein
MIEPDRINIRNKRAGFDFEIIQSFEAGIMLTGSEIKSIRDGGGSINEAFCLLRDEELYIKNMNIPEYSHGSYSNHEPTRLRKLLLKKRELERITAKIKEKGFSIIPVRVFINERGFAKMEVALARGKKKFDKRDSLKQKETKREMDRVMKKYR